MVTVLILSWILCICSGKKIAAYLSDITGAFDRVFKDFLLAKLYAAGMGTQYLNFLDSYLQPRQGKVIVEGVASDIFEIADTVFQGTVLGPCLWNVFFSDVAVPASSTGGEEAMFADDLNVFKKYDRSTQDAFIKGEMAVCRARVHKWGRANRVSFDPNKEHIVIVHPIHANGDPFKLLGCMVDCKLRMDQAIDRILIQIRPKIRAILRTRKYYPAKVLINQFKTHVWSLMEIHNGAIFHASTTLLERLDSVQRSFLHELEITEECAFIDHNFAPPTLRRNIGILGLLQKRVLGKNARHISKTPSICS